MSAPIPDIIPITHGAQSPPICFPMAQPNIPIKNARPMHKMVFSIGITNINPSVIRQPKKTHQEDK